MGRLFGSVRLQQANKSANSVRTANLVKRRCEYSTDWAEASRLCEMIDDRPIYLRRQTNTTNNLQKKLRGASALEMTGNGRPSNWPEHP